MFCSLHLHTQRVTCVDLNNVNHLNFKSQHWEEQNRSKNELHLRFLPWDELPPLASFCVRKLWLKTDAFLIAQTRTNDADAIYRLVIRGL